MLRQYTSTITATAPRQGLHEITSSVSGWLREQDIETGLLTLFCRHTSASLLIQENAASAARRDLETWFARVVPEDRALYTHNDEGPDDMPAHLKAALTGVNLSIPVSGGNMLLGTWQGLFLAEHRARPHRRQVVCHAVGE